ncbi:MAG: hypothetical protein R2851_15165 [Caldilineaceae bacterium]
MSNSLRGVRGRRPALATAASATAASAALVDGLTGLRARLQLGQAEHLFNLSNFPRVAALTDVAAPVLQSEGDMAGLPRRCGWPGRRACA